jgi:hypothetical protein
MGAAKKHPSTGETDLTTPEAVERFRNVVAAYVREHGRSEESARKALIDAGLYNKSGTLKKKFRA